MNILFTRFSLESAYGGAEVQTLSLMKGLKEKGHEMIFLGSCPVLLEQTEKLKIKNVKCNIGLPPVTKLHAISFLWRKKYMQQSLINKLQTTHYKLQTILMLSITEKILLTPWALQQGIKVYWVEHDRIGHWLTWNPWLPVLRKLSKKITTIVVSDLSKKMYRDLGWDEKKVVAIPNGVEIKKCSTPSPLPSPQGGGNTLHIGCIARLTPDKGVDLLIDAVTDTPEVELTILGRGPKEGYLCKIIKERNLSNRIRIQSWIDDIGDFYSSINVLALPSREHDPFGMVAAEAMGCGVPVIVTQACGIAGYLHDGVDAVVIPANSSLALKEAILKMKTRDVRDRLSENGRKTAKEKFSLENMVDSYENILSSPSPGWRG